MLVAAPLLVLGRPLIAFLWAMPMSWARALGNAAKAGWWQQVWRAMTNPFVAWAVHAAALWVWHIPLLFQAKLKNEWVHTAQHVSFLFSALLFWCAIVHARRGLMGYGAGVLPNTPSNVIRWIQNPPGVDHQTAMPNLGITDSDARDITSYLYTLK